MNKPHPVHGWLLVLVLGSGALFLLGGAIRNGWRAAHVGAWIETTATLDAAAVGLRTKNPSSRGRSNFESTLTIAYRYTLDGQVYDGYGTFDYPFGQTVPKTVSVFVNPTGRGESIPSPVRDEYLRQGAVHWLITFTAFGLFCAAGAVIMSLALLGKA